MMYWLWKLEIIDKSHVWLSKVEEFLNCSWQSYCMAVTNHWQFFCMALSLKKSLTILLFGFQKSLTIFLYGFELVNNHWQTSCMAVTNHWQMSIMALSQKVDKITGNSWQNYCNSFNSWWGSIILIFVFEWGYTHRNKFWHPWVFSVWTSNLNHL